jgi:hypothetical protein
LGSGKGDWGGKGEGRGQSTSNLGPEWTGVATNTKEGFQVSKRDSRIGEGSSGKGGIIKGVRQGVHAMCSHILYVNPVYIVLLCICRANKRIVFRL